MNKVVIITRFAYTPIGTFGRIEIPDKGFSCFSIEKEWADNRQSESCIPEGVYRLKLGRYNRGDYPTYEVLDVPGREYIKFHVANTTRDLLGCIGPGERLGYIGDLWAVTQSRAAFGRFMSAMGGDEDSTLLIRSWGGSPGLVRGV